MNTSFSESLLKKLGMQGRPYAEIMDAWEDRLILQRRRWLRLLGPVSASTLMAVLLVGLHALSR